MLLHEVALTSEAIAGTPSRLKKVGFIVWSVKKGVLSDALASPRIPEDEVGALGP